MLFYLSLLARLVPRSSSLSDDERPRDDAFLGEPSSLMLGEVGESFRVAQRSVLDSVAEQNAYSIHKLHLQNSTGKAPKKQQKQLL